MARDEAAAALREVEAAGEKARELRTYRQAAPYVLMWGLVWLVGNLTTQFKVEFSELVWTTAILAIIACSIVLGMVQAQQRRPVEQTEKERLRAARARRRGMATSALSWAAFAAFIAVLQPMSYRQFDAAISLIWMFIYMGVGIWVGWRLFVIGAVGAAAILFGFFFLHSYFYLWMGVVAGGALILGGLWMRKV